MEKYSINITWSNNDNVFIGTVLEFPSLSAFGKTPAEALKETEIVLEGYIEICKEDGIPLPEPQKLHEYSGQLRIRIPKQLHKDLAIESEKNGTSLNTHIIYLLAENHGVKNLSKPISTTFPVNIESETTKPVPFASELINNIALGTAGNQYSEGLLISAMEAVQ